MCGAVRPDVVIVPQAPAKLELFETGRRGPPCGQRVGLLIFRRC